MTRAALRSTGCSAIRLRKRCNEWARLCVKSGPKRSPRTYSILCLSGSGGTAHCGYSLESCFQRKTKSVKRRRTENSGFWKDWKSDCGGCLSDAERVRVVKLRAETHLCGYLVRDILVLGACQLFLRAADECL